MAEFSWLTALGFVFLTFNSGMAIYRSDGDVAAVAFVAASYVDLVLPFVCLRLFEKSPSDSPARGNFKTALWVLATLLTVIFSYKVAAIMPVLVCAVTAVTVLGGLYAFFSFEKGGPSSAAREKNQQREALFSGRPAGEIAQAEMNRDDVGFSWLTLHGFAFLTFNSGMAVYSSNGDVAVVAFVASSNVDLLLPFVSPRLFENSEPHSPSPARGNLKVAVWVLTTILMVVFSYKVVAIMPVPVQLLVWAMAGATVLGGLYVFFVHTGSKVAAIMPVSVQVLVWAMASATVVFAALHAFINMHKESKVMAIITPMPETVLVWAMAGATVLGGFYAFFLHRESKEGKSCRRDRVGQNLGVMAIVFGSSVLLDHLVVPPSMEGGNGVRLTALVLIALATFLCGSAVTLLTLPGLRFFGSRLDAVVNHLALGCIVLYMLALLEIVNVLH